MDSKQLNNNWEETYKVWTEKQFNNFINKLNMEPKKKFNWLRIWQIVRDILVALLTAEGIANKV